MVCLRRLDVGFRVLGLGRHLLLGLLRIRDLRGHRDPLLSDPGQASVLHIVKERLSADQQGGRHGHRHQLDPQGVQKGGACGDGGYGRRPLRGGLGQNVLQILPLFSDRGLQPVQQRHQEGDRGQAEELDALGLQRPDPLFDGFFAVVYLDPHGGGVHAQLGSDLPGVHPLIEVHGRDHALARRQIVQDLPDLPLDLFGLQLHLRGGVGTLVRNLHGLVRVLGGQVGEENGLPLPQQLLGAVHGDLPQPGEKGLRAAELVEAGEGLEIGILLNVQGQVLVPDHGAYAAVELLIAELVKIGERVPVADRRFTDQLCTDFRRLFLFFCA